MIETLSLHPPAKWLREPEQCKTDHWDSCKRSTTQIQASIRHTFCKNQKKKWKRVVKRSISGSAAHPGSTDRRRRRSSEYLQTVNTDGAQQLKLPFTKYSAQIRLSHKTTKECRDAARRIKGRSRSRHAYDREALPMSVEKRAVASKSVTSTISGYQSPTNPAAMVYAMVGKIIWGNGEAITFGIGSKFRHWAAAAFGGSDLPAPGRRLLLRNPISAVVCGVFIIFPIRVLAATFITKLLKNCTAASVTPRSQKWASGTVAKSLAWLWIPAFTSICWSLVWFLLNESYALRVLHMHSHNMGCHTLRKSVFSTSSR